jgi:hypothetical protein
MSLNNISSIFLLWEGVNKFLIIVKKGNGQSASLPYAGLQAGQSFYFHEGVKGPFVYPRAKLL